jgi:hypothetical protein
MVTTPPQCDLNNLAQAAQQGDRQALELFAQHASGMVTSIASQILRGNRLRRWIDPSDVSQIVIFKVCFRLANPNSDLVVLNWNGFLRRVTYRSITDQARSLRNELRNFRSSQTIAELAKDRLSTAHGCHVEDSIFSREQAPGLLAELQSQIPSKLRSVWQLRAQGASWNKIASLVGENPNTLRVRFNNAIRRIQIPDVSRAAGMSVCSVCVDTSPLEGSC